MQISLATSAPTSKLMHFGYSDAYNNIKLSIERLRINDESISVLQNSKGAKLQIYMGKNPGEFYRHQYKIQMTQWESTVAPNSWHIYARKYNEFWTANYFGASAIERSGVPAEKIFVMEHGVDSSIWTPKLRGNGNKIRFLHIDSDNPRKRSDLALEAFKMAFGDNPDYELTLKYALIKNSYKNIFPQSSVSWDRTDILEHHGEWYKNVRRIRETMTIPDLVKLVHFHDVLIYPSEGEGFGLIPLQALVSGMPVISTGIWPSYEKYINGNIIDSKLGKSTHMNGHFPGQCIIPSPDSTVEMMKQVAANISSQSDLFYSRVPEIQAEYSWDAKTHPAITELYSRVPEKFI